MKLFNFKKKVIEMHYGEKKEVEILNYPKIIGFSVAGLFTLITLFSCFTTVNSGEVGLKVRFGKVQNTQIDEGFNFKIPYAEKIVKVNIKVQKSEVETSAASKDLQDINTKIAVNYRVDGTKASSLYKNIGNSYDEKVLEPAIQESIKAVISKYTAEEVITKRSEVSILCMETLQEKVDKYGLIVDNFNIINFNFSAEYSKAIEEKQVAEQQVLKAQQELEKTKIEAAQKVEEAKAEAEALRVQKEEITEELLRLREIEAKLKAIEKWNGQLPTYNLGDNVPFINLK